MTQGLRGAIVTSVLLLAASRGAGGQQPPRFQSSVDVTSVDVSVVDDNGRPVQNLAPSDFAVRVAAVGFGPGSPATTFTADRERLKQAVARMVGQRQSTFGAMHEIALSEALAIVRGDPIMLTTVMSRECQQQTAARTPGTVEMCLAQVTAESELIAADARRESDETVRGLRD